MRTSNPALRNDAFAAPADNWSDLGMSSYEQKAAARPDVMTMQGTVNKSALLIAVTIVCAIVGWGLMESNPGLMIPLWIIAMIAMIGGPILCCRNPKLARVTAPIVALALGPFVGGISMIFAQMTSGGQNSTLVAGMPDLILNAGLLTFGIFGGLLAAYSLKLIRPGKVFHSIVATATMGVFFYALLAMGASFFGSHSLISVYDPNNGGMVSIGFSLFLVVLASANLVLDFDMISNGVRNRAPRHMEWFAAQGLLITLVWLYIEVLRLLAKLQSRD